MQRLKLDMKGELPREPLWPFHQLEAQPHPQS